MAAIRLRRRQALASVLTLAGWWSAAGATAQEDDGSAWAAGGRGVTPIGPATTTTTTLTATTSTPTTLPAPTMLPAPTTSPTVPGIAPTPRGTSPASREQVEAIADDSEWDWRAAGVRFSVGFYAGACCHWGIYDSQRSTVWIGPTAFDSPARLRYVVLHELAHGWQYRTGRLAQLSADYQPWGWSGIGAALEAGADCIAILWGATSGHYWSCPSGARGTAARRLAGDWR